MKNTVKNFNNLIKKTIFKVQNKTNDNFKISNFNKYLIAFICLLFFYLFYLLIPFLYDKTWVQTNIENKLLNNFNINVSTSADISYHILPSPHFLIKDSKILVDDSKKQKSIAEIKNLKVFLSQSNFFDKKKMNLKKIIISEANISLLRSDFKLLRESRNKKYSNNKIKINNSNAFLKNNLGEVISIIKINQAILFFDNKKLLNFFNLSGEVFNIPFTFELKNYSDLTKHEEVNFNAETLKLNIFNESFIKKNNLLDGKNIISFFNSKIDTNYKVREKLIFFESSKSKIYNSKIKYKGELSINPFDLNLDIHLDNLKISRLFNINDTLIELINSELLFNENISIKTSVFINSNLKNAFFQSAKVNFHFTNGKINFNNSRLVNDKIGSLELSNSNLFFKDNKLVLNSDILIDIKNSDRLYSSLNTNKKLRKKIKNIFINFDYDFITQQFKFNNVKVDNIVASEQLLTAIEGFNHSNFKNFIKNRRLINQLLKVAYDDG
ncbi:hypothetical protein OAO77_01675 [Candidatus Pelagibacter sp.]|nr:hypothetical protein [Candidatus Pelagibacter sp.]